MIALIKEKLMDDYKITPDKKIKLKDIDPDDSGEFKHKDDAQKQLSKDLLRIRALQEALYAEHKRSLLIVLQAMDTGGKDGTIEHVCGAMNPQGVVVTPFKVPSAEEMAHDYLWRVHKVAPGKGMIGVFNRSHYEDVLVVRVHELVPKEVWGQRYEQINQFEQFLAANGTVILKFFLHISKAEQKERFEERLTKPSKHWKFSRDDLKMRNKWDRYMVAYEDALNLCNTPWAPWHIVPADKKWYRNLVISQVLVETLEKLDLRYPEPEPGLETIVIPD